MINYINFNKNNHIIKDQDAYWNSGYNYPLHSICQLLGVSRSWVEHTLLPNIDRVVYDPKFVFKKTGKYSLIFIRKTDLSNWLIKNASFEAQTELIDLYSYLSQKPSIASVAYKMYKSNKRVEKGESRPIMPMNVLEYVNKNLTIFGVESNLNCKERKFVPWVNIEPFDIFDRLEDMYTLKNHNISRETLYRRAFLNGDVRIKIGNGISIYFKSHHNSMKMPFLIPYNKPIRVL